MVHPCLGSYRGRGPSLSAPGLAVCAISPGHIPSHLRRYYVRYSDAGLTIGLNQRTISTEWLVRLARTAPSLNKVHTRYFICVWIASDVSYVQVD